MTIPTVGSYKLLCPVCKKDVRETAKFCRHCRAALLPPIGAAPSNCLNCLVPLSPEAKFCKECGHRVGTPVIHKEHAPADAVSNQTPAISPTPLVELPLTLRQPPPYRETSAPGKSERPVILTSTAAPKISWLIVGLGLAALAFGLGGGWWWWSQKNAPISEVVVAQPEISATPAPPAVPPVDPADNSSPLTADTLATAPSESSPIPEAKPEDAATLEAEQKTAAEKKAAERKAAAEVRKAKEREAKAAAAAQQAALEKAAEEQRIAAEKAAQAKVQQRQAPSPESDWYAAIQTEYIVCEKQNFFQKVLCIDKARRTYCPGHWGSVRECSVQK